MSDTNDNLRAVLGWAARHAAPGTVLAEEVAEAELELAELRAAPRAATEPLTRERLAAALHAVLHDMTAEWCAIQAPRILAALHGAEPAPSSLEEPRA